MNRRDFFRLSARAAAAGLILPTWGRSMVAVPGFDGPIYCKRYDYIIYDDLPEFSPYLHGEPPFVVFKSGHLISAREFFVQNADVKLVKP